jgi:hypothetical protein
MQIATIRAGLVLHHDPTLVDELLATYQEAKKNFYVGGLRLNAVEGGRFCEAAFRMLEQRMTGGQFTPIGTTLNTNTLANRLENATTCPDSVRFHIPRSLRVVYDIRNKRDTAHLGDGIDPNVQDATLIVGILDWVLAEFVRLYHAVSPNEAQKIVESLVRRQAPVVQDFSGFPKVLRNLSASDHVLVLLYDRSATGAAFTELEAWVRPPMRGNLRRTLTRLVTESDKAHFDGSRYFITQKGIQDAEDRRLLLPE